MVKKTGRLVNGPMSFKEATDALFTPMSHDEAAEALDCSVALIRQARRDPKSPSFRNPPGGWEVTIVSLLEKKSVEFAMYAARLKDRKRGL